MSDDTISLDVEQRLLERIAALEAQLAPKPPSDTRMLDINDVRVPYVYRPFPRCVYRQADTPGQIDHPGNQVTLAKDEKHLTQLLADGWSKEPFPAPVAEPEPKSAPSPKKGKAA